ncbi:N-acetylglucosamine-6-phosphate deacetylase [Anthonomus grandis grandis]|uniref:N-acetylglucosamine-6-phosphate deacetylase n=1 Tax=Anthonomus grandis grandis TaxID=2921223 RepID=UPI002165D140|nr:N-acetylglucosamine-6-phosphate deacetylase [Anthonomus grandis grandis]XP_050299780.1 N-acetylglucosamine-6-phosphate deacetylase [Anthonomus grandis grandis]XP_050299781.1 N-acetylglucosamine-6-phosphate deacetylase [Anthonomus grandis grandis]
MSMSVPLAGKLYQFINCQIIRDHKFIKEDLWVRDGKIVDPEKIFYDEQVVADVKIDCKSRMITPGFIDLQINGGFGFDFSFHEDTHRALDVVSKGILEHGVTAYCPTVVTSPPDIYRRVLPRIYAKQGGKFGATILGAHVEGPFISKEKKGAHPIDCILDFNQGMSEVQTTYGAFENIKIVTLAPELKNSSTVIEELTKKQIIVSLGHSSADLDESERAALSGATLITHLFNAMMPFHHRDPGLVGLLATELILKGRKIFFGIIADNIHTHPAALRIAYRVHPEGLVLVTDAISALGLQAGKHKIGQLDIEIRDNKAYIAHTNTLCGSIAPMITCVQNLIAATACSPEYALEAASYHPARVLGIEKQKGTLNYGADADFVMLNDDFSVSSTWINGECVYEANLSGTTLCNTEGAQ